MTAMALAAIPAPMSRCVSIFAFANPATMSARSFAISPRTSDISPLSSVLTRSDSSITSRSPDDAERVLTHRHFVDAADRLHPGEGRADAAPVDQRVDGCLVTLCDNFDRSVGPVANGASDTKSLRLVRT